MLLGYYLSNYLGTFPQPKPEQIRPEVRILLAFVRVFTSKTPPSLLGIPKASLAEVQF